MKSVARHNGAGLKTAALSSSTITERQIEDEPGVLALDHSGRVVSYTPSAERWLRDLEDLAPTWRESRSLPVALGMIVRALKPSLDTGSDLDSSLVLRVRVRARSGRWLTLYGSLTEPVSERPSDIMVVVEPTKPEEVAWLDVAAHGLSPREEEVVELIVRGLSNRQISKELFISGNTVQRHISNIFEKVGVRSRKELLKRLFFENLLPGVVGS